MNQKDDAMSNDKALHEIAEFWDTYSLADYWDQTEPAEFG
jgi:hypothetical protein